MCELAPAVFRLSVRPFLVAAMGGVCGIALIFMATETPVEDQFRITPSIRAPGAAPFRPQGHLVVRVLDKVVIDSWYDRVDVEADRNALLWLRFILGAGLGGYCGWVLGGGWAYATREV